MKNYKKIAIALAALVVSLSCQMKEMDTLNKEISINLAFCLAADNGNYLPGTKSSSEEIFNSFYGGILSGELVAPSYELEFINMNTGDRYEETGKWGNNDLITLKTGRYRVIGKSTALGDNIQDKCSLVFDDEVVIEAGTSVLTLKAYYDCSLIVFSDSSISSIMNYNGETSSELFQFSDYYYAFINDYLYKDNYKSEAFLIVKHTNDEELKCYTGNLNFEKGKYYVFNNLTAFSEFVCDFSLEEMEQGIIDLDNESVINILLPPADEIWYESHSGNTIPLAKTSSLLVSNTYTNGKGVYKFSKALTDIEGLLDYSKQCGTTKENEDFKTLILPENVSRISQFGISHLSYATTLVLPYKLASLGSDCICGLGEKTPETTNVYFIGEVAPSFVSTSIWNMHDLVSGGKKIDNFHYPENNDTYKSLLSITIQGTAKHNWVPSQYNITVAD